MTECWATHLRTVTEQVLQVVAFSFTDPLDREGVLTPGGPVLAAEVRFSEVRSAGARAGAVRLAAPAELCRRLAAEASGAESDDVATEAAGDMLGELANMVCGQWLTAAFGTGRVFRLSPPQGSTVSDPEWAGLWHDPATTGFVVDDLPFLANLICEGDNP